MSGPLAHTGLNLSTPVYLAIGIGSLIASGVVSLIGWTKRKLSRA